MFWPDDDTLPQGWQDWSGGDFPDGRIVIWSGAHELRKLQVVFARIAPSGFPTDPAVITQHFINITGGSPDATWVDADFVAVEDAFTAFWNAIKANYSTGTIVDQYRWYKDGPAFHPTPAEGNPAVRVVETNLPGTGTSNPLPVQVAVSVTERTAIRKRWGRFYLPNPTIGSMSSNGYMSEAFAQLVADSAHTYLEACRTAEILPVVWSPSTESSFEVERVQVDNLYDVIRSRRWKQPTLRASHDLMD